MSPDDPSEQPRPRPRRPVASDGTARRPRRRSVLGTLALGGVFTACGVLFSTSARLSGGTSIRDDDGDVSTVLRRQDQQVEEMARENADKQERIDELSEPPAREDDDEQDTEQLSQAVGLSEVRGPGLRVTLTDAPASARDSHEDVTADDLVVHQQDMESYVNALWAGGTEAMMLQDQRVINGSAFRCAGNTLLLQGRVYSPPFTITAIGDSARLESALDEAPGVEVFRQWRDYVGLGEKIDVLSQVTLPGYQGALALDSARAADEDGS